MRSPTTRRPLRRLADEDGAGRRCRLEPGGGIDDVARNHALVGRADGDRRLPRQDPCPSLDPRAEDMDGADQLQGRPDAPLGVILAGDRRAPHGHDRIADELLDEPPVTSDDLGRDVEVAGEGLADLLAVALLGERRKPYEIGEQDRDEAPLGGRRLGSGELGLGVGSRSLASTRGHGAHRRNGRRRQLGATFTAELLAHLVRRGAARAGRGQGSSALGAEPPAGTILGPATRTRHSDETSWRVSREYPIGV